ncbi:TPA: hypothetical protein HA278_08475 [Candidatus Woesearchaeota archaeon]|nr:hypothetical protein [Candidatus Woesearchaeota archaeon]
MIKEMAFGVADRCHLVDVSKTSEWQNINRDTFVSLYDYDEYVREFVAKFKRMAGFDGLIYIPDEFILDVDGSNTEHARQSAIGLCILLKDLMIPYRIYFSGTGFHFGIPSTAFRWKPDRQLHLKVKAALKNAGIFQYADPAVTDKTRIIRLNNTLNSKSKLWKVLINEGMLNTSAKEIQEYAVGPKDDQPFDLECEPVFDVLTKQTKTTRVETVNFGRTPDPVNYPCIQTMTEGVTEGSRHQTALVVAAHFRWLYPELLVRQVMEWWRQMVDNNPNQPFTNKEMESIVENCYTGHGGSGYRYGCDNPIMDRHCKNTCKLYKAKKSQSVMNATAMDQVLMEFYSSDQRAINIGGLYGQNFPIYPGEVVILQAPPKSMKTMLLQNWVNSLKRRTYFMEMEMSPRQIWSRFVQIQQGWNEEQLIEHYKTMRNGIAKDFDWLIMDYSSCYPQELQKRISMLPEKPEIVVVDHMGLLRSKKQDNNMKVEEASQALMELAVQNNIIVFAVSEITKTAFHEGMNLASSKGSFRIAYNANKVLSLNPIKGFDGKIQQLHIKSEANREKETLNVKLWVNGVKIAGQETSAYEKANVR